MEEVIDAAKQAQIHDTIMSWTDGYGTLVRNQGKNFSGGQRQRMAIARAILSKSPILILDEPTASLDALAEFEVFQSFADLTKGKMALLISHRFSTVRMVDRIVVLQDGRIVEQGSHQHLLSLGGRYTVMFDLQASGYR